MRRPIFVNEIIGRVGSDNEPRYNMTENSDSTVKFALANPVQTPGTPINADNMNNLFDFDNLASMQGNTKTTTFSGDTITEEIVSSGAVNASRVTTIGAGAIVEVTSVFSDDGVSLLRRTTVVTRFSGAGIIEEVS